MLNNSNSEMLKEKARAVQINIEAHSLISQRRKMVHRIPAPFSIRGEFMFLYLGRFVN